MHSRMCVLVISFLLCSLKAFAAPSESDLLLAKKLYERMTGVKVSVKKAELQAVAEQISLGNNTEAAKLVANSSDFLNVQIKNLSLRLSNKDESVKVPFNDFSALIMGIVRDNRDFRDVLTGNYYYELSGVANADDKRTRYFNQNNYSTAESTFTDIAKALVFKSPQELVTVSADTLKNQSALNYEIVTTKPRKDAAGVLTTRTFAERNLGGGSNRRAVEFSLKQFLCVSMAEAADSNASDQFVGRDVERFPAGDHNKYLTSCKSCHAVMDGMRGAFAKSDYGNFSNGAATTIYSQVHGDFFNSEGIAASYTKYQAEVVNPAVATLIPDLETNQANSDLYKVRYDDLIARGATAASAKSQMDSLLNTIRDPAVVVSLTTDYRTKKAAKLADFRTNKDNATYRTNYVKSCLDHFSNTALSAATQETNFLRCNLDNKKELSELYLHYNQDLTAKAVAANEKDRLLGKLINRGRDSNTDMVIPYLRAKEQLKLFPRNAFDSETGVALKMNKGNFAYGFVVKDDTFVNNAVLGSKAGFFGWRGSSKSGGKGLNDFGRMLADSRRFSQCMAKRAYEGVCLKKISSTDTAMLQRLGDRFESLNYNLKNLYQAVALDPSCGIVKGN
ncbi:hypothetical protein AZI86_14355 [Bdellovibrio bacteriovorus]|uniref:DUF1585 domain-containing protein n=1 Tax=Bdellovibrio bacteriovorus TaxID=959 RepID=A0A150WJP5_BDEBC|nr:hypothetical protein [Bdellovibrio bacteriovorus]KYG63988.1 hypothetical protein AZI86_14355 [Bdellovibrio bacteriovorus]